MSGTCYNFFNVHFRLLLLIVLSGFIMGQLHAQDSSATSKFDIGENALDGKNYQKAIKYYTKALVLDPKFAKAYRQRAQAYFFVENYDLSIRDYTKSIEFYTDNDSLLSVLYCKRGRVYDFAEKSDSAIMDFNMALKIKKENKEAISYKGLALLNLQNYSDAATYLNDAINKYPENKYWQGVLYRCLGECHYELKKIEIAIEDCNNAIQLNPDNGSAFWQRAEILESQKNYEDAIIDYNKSMRYFLNDKKRLATIYRLRALDYFKSGQTEKAIKDCERAIEANPKSGPAYRTRAIIFLADPNKKAEAKADLEKLAIIDSVPTYYTTFGKYFLGKTVAAMADMQVILNRAETNALKKKYNFYDISCMYALMKMEQEALKYLEKSFQEGYNNFQHIRQDSDLDSIRESSAFKELVLKYDKNR